MRRLVGRVVDRVERRFRELTRPRASVFLGTAADLVRGKKDLVFENALLRQRLGSLTPTWANGLTRRRTSAAGRHHTAHSVSAIAIAPRRVAVRPHKPGRQHRRARAALDAQVPAHPDLPQLRLARGRPWPPDSPTSHPMAVEPEAPRCVVGCSPAPRAMTRPAGLYIRHTSCPRVDREARVDQARACFQYRVEAPDDEQAAHLARRHFFGPATMTCSLAAQPTRLRRGRPVANFHAQ